MITYPVNPNGRFTFKLGGTVKRGVLWPREDGMPLQGPQAGAVVLEEIIAPLPVFNPATHKLDSGNWVDDEVNETATFSRAVIPLTQAELDAAADQQARQAKRVLVAAAIPTLRTWATQASAVVVTTGNNVTVTQQLVDHSAIFYARFADLLEAIYIDK